MEFDNEPCNDFEKKCIKLNLLTKLDSSGDAKLSRRTLTFTVKVSVMSKKKHKVK